MTPKLLTRVQTALVLFAIVAVTLWLGGFVLTALAVGIFVACNIEFYSLIPSLTIARKIQCVILNAMIPFGYLFFGWQGMAFSVLLSATALCMLNVLIVEGDNHQVSFTEMTPGTFVGFGYMGVLASFIILATQANNASLYMAWLFGIVIFSDMFSYFGGTRIGGIKLAPRISPNKTVAGSVCGLLGALLAAILGGYVLGFPFSVYMLLCYGTLAGILAQVGDLFESLVKRIYQVKDSGELLPGHGGVLDRVDSYLFCVAMIFFLPPL